MPSAPRPSPSRCAGLGSARCARPTSPTTAQTDTPTITSVASTIHTFRIRRLTRVTNLCVAIRSHERQGDRDRNSHQRRVGRAGAIVVAEPLSLDRIELVGGRKDRPGQQRRGLAQIRGSDREPLEVVGASGLDQTGVDRKLVGDRAHCRARHARSADLAGERRQRLRREAKILEVVRALPGRLEPASQKRRGRRRVGVRQRARRA